MTLPHLLDVVNKIWCHSEGSWVFQSTKSPQGQWLDSAFRVHGPPSTKRNYPTDLFEQPHGYDMFFSALRFSEPRRSNENFVGASVLFADLDPVDPAGLTLKPSIAWETSPGMYQAVWFLEETITDYQEWAGLNQRLTHYTGADPGGWMASKALRWPGSLNWKRAQGGMVPVGQVLWTDGPTYAAVSLHDLLPALPSKRVEVLDDHPEPPDHRYVSGARRMYMRRYWNKMGMRSRSMLTKQRVGDRSLHIAMVVRNLLHDGLSPEEVFSLVWAQPWCKFRTDRDAPEVLWQEIQKASQE